MKRKQWLMVIVFITVYLVSADARELISLDKARGKLFPAADVFEQQTIVLSDDQVGLLQEAARVSIDGAHSRRIVFFTAKQGNTVLGYIFRGYCAGEMGADPLCPGR